MQHSNGAIRSEPAGAPIRGPDPSNPQRPDHDPGLAEQARVLTEAAHELAAEIRRREDVQTAVTQARKLEMLGLLSSSIAHDVTGVLSAISNSYDILSEGNDKSRQLKVIDYGRRAIAHAMGLSQRLQSGARKETAAPRAVFPADLMPDLTDLVRQAIKNRGDGAIRLEVAVGADLWPVIADFHRLEAVVIELASSVHATLTASGRVSLSVRNHAATEVAPAGLLPGDHVVIAVAGTEVAQKLHRDSDLSLAMAHAFAKDSGGILRIGSGKDGRATVIELFLPRANLTPTALAAGAFALAAVHRGGTILFVDPDRLQRQEDANRLRDLRYRVLEAANAEAGLALSYSVPGLDLVISQVVLPGAGGVELARHLRIERPDLPVLFLTTPSGRTPVPSGATSLERPVPSGALAAAILRLLAARQAGADRAPVATEQLIARLHTPALRRVVEAWRNGRGYRPLPKLSLGTALVADWADHAVLAAVTPEAGGGLQMLSIGRALSDQTGVAPADALLGPATACVRSLLPHYDVERRIGRDGLQCLTERLLLPVSEDGLVASHVVGVVLDGRIPAATGSPPLSPPPGTRDR